MTLPCYLDFNATSPLSPSVLEFLKQGEVDFKNPSSRHLAGQKARAVVNKTINILQSFFSLPEYRVVFNSGASESMATIFSGWVRHQLSLKKKPHVVVFNTDHSSAMEQKDFLEQLGAKVYEISVGPSGNFPYQDCLEYIQSSKKKQPAAEFLISFLFVNNETGVVWDLEFATSLKEATGCQIVVDAVQSVGKTMQFNKLSPQLDAYVYSGHKFGALKGVGFCLLKPDFFYYPLVVGGGQQSAHRSGTENVLGVHSLSLALADVEEIDIAKTTKAREQWERDILNRYQNRVILVGENAAKRCSQTTTLIFKEQSADFLVSFFDQQGFQVSSGSACSSGSALPNRNLLALGFKEHASSGVRFSFPFDSKAYTTLGQQVLESFTSLIGK